MPDTDKPAPQFTNPPPFNNNEQSKVVNMSDKECLHIVARNERTGDRWQCAQCGKSFDDRDKPAPQFGEPWAVDQTENHETALKRHWIMRDGCPIGEMSYKADAERIVACVNALANIPDPQAFVREVRELLKQWLDDDFECDAISPLIGATEEMLARLDAGRGRDNA